MNRQIHTLTISRARYNLVLGVALILAGCQDAQNRDLMNPPAPEPISESLFNGKDLSGWDGDPRFWSVENGAIVGATSEETPTEANTFLIWQGAQPDDFELHYRIRLISESGNSGAQIRSERFTDDEHPDLKHRVRGYQVDFAISDWIPGILYDERGRGVLARRGQRVKIDGMGERQEERFAEEDDLAQYVKLNDWNQYEVVASGDTIRSRINGELMHELIDESPDAEHEGIIAFQIHRGRPMRLEISSVELTNLEPGMSPSF